MPFSAPSPQAAAYGRWTFAGATAPIAPTALVGAIPQANAKAMIDVSYESCTVDALTAFSGESIGAAKEYGNRGSRQAP